MINPDYILHILKVSNRLYQSAADYWIEESRQAINRHGQFYVALTGGTTPAALYQLLATVEYARQVEWSKIQVFIGDERFVPADHPDNNFLMAKETLLNRVNIPAENLHPVRTDFETASQSAEHYASEIDRCLPKSGNGLPNFDLIMLGMGNDGHTASLFPDTDILHTTDKMVDAAYVKKMDSWRISMTYPCLNNARRVMFMASGESKAGILQHVLAQGAPDIYPVQRVHAIDETHWFIDEAAASQLDLSS